MTGVLDPTTAAAPRKSLARDPKIGSGVPNNVRLLDSRRGDVAQLLANDDAARPPVLEVNKDAPVRPPIVSASTCGSSAASGRGWLSLSSTSH